MQRPETRRLSRKKEGILAVCLNYRAWKGIEKLKQNKYKIGSAAVDSEVNSVSSALIFDKLKWMNSQEAALFLRVSVGQIRNLVWRGELKSYRLQNRLRFLRSDLERLVKPAF